MAAARTHVLLLLLLLPPLLAQLVGDCDATEQQVLRNAKAEARNRSRPSLDPSGMQHVFHVVYHPVAECIVELLVYWRQSRAAFLIDHSTGLDEAHLRKYLKKTPVEVDVISVDGSLPVPRLVEGLRHSSHSNCVVICNDSHTTQILSQANEQRMFSRRVSWIVSSSNRTPAVLRPVHIEADAQVTVVAPPTDHNLARARPSSVARLHLFDVFHSSDTNATESVRFATWRADRRLVMLKSLDPDEAEHGIRGRHVRTIYKEHGPYAMATGKTGGASHGYMVDLMKLMMTAFNLRPCSLEKVDTEFGMGVNGTFTGLVGIIHSKEADFSFNVLAMTESRKAGVRYVVAVSKGFIAIAYKRPQVVMPPTIYLLPFTVRVWAVSAASIAVLVAAIALGWTAPWKSPRSRGTTTLARAVLTGDFIIDVFTKPRGLLTRTMFGTLLLMVVLVFAHYTSMLTSSLTYSEVPVPFDTLEGLVANFHYKVLLVRNTRDHDTFKSATSGVYAQVWLRVSTQTDQETFTSTHLEASKRMMGTTVKYAYIADGPTIVYDTAGNCEVSFVSHRYSVEFYFMTARYDFPYSKLFKLWLIHAMEAGILVRLSTQYNLYHRPMCAADNVSPTFGLDQVVGVFFLWACGLLLSLLVLLAEKVAYRPAVPPP